MQQALSAHLSPLCCSCLAQIQKDLHNSYLFIYCLIQLLTRGQIPPVCRFLNYIFIPHREQLKGFLLFISSGNLDHFMHKIKKPLPEIKNAWWLFTEKRFIQYFTFRFGSVFTTELQCAKLCTQRNCTPNFGFIANNMKTSLSNYTSCWASQHCTFITEF